MQTHPSTPLRAGRRTRTLRNHLLTGSVIPLLAAGLLVANGGPASATTSGLPSPTPEEALWYAVSYDMTQHADSLRQETASDTRKANLYQARYIAKLLKRTATRASVLETASTLCAKLDEATGTNGVLRAAGHYMRTAPADSLFPGHFPRNQAGLREEIDTLLRRTAGRHAGLLCENHAEGVSAVVETWKGAAWAGHVAKRVARNVTLAIGKNTSKGTVDEKTKAVLATALGTVCGMPVNVGGDNPCILSGAPGGLAYSYGELERRAVGVHYDGADGIRCNASVTLEARPGKKPVVIYGSVSCFLPQQ